jgi:hypothetical protein
MIYNLGEKKWKGSLSGTEGGHLVNMRIEEYQPTTSLWLYFICDQAPNLVQGNKYTS